MNVAELILKLQDLDQTLPVYVAQTDDPFDHSELPVNAIKEGVAETVANPGPHGRFERIPCVLIDLY